MNESTLSVTDKFNLSLGDKETTASISETLSKSWDVFCSVCLLSKKNATFLELQKHKGRGENWLISVITFLTFILNENYCRPFKTTSVCKTKYSLPFRMLKNFSQSDWTMETKNTQVGLLEIYEPIEILSLHFDLFMVHL